LHATVSSLGEHALITRITARLAMPPWVLVGPGDDAAVIEPERGALEVITTDAQVEGIHFDRRFVPPDAIGYRALAVNLSDLAAMGAQPRAAVLSLALPDAMDAAVVDGVVDGLLVLAAAQRVTIVGGNITRTTGPMMIDITALGSVRRRRVLTRSAARPGDEVWVTGMLGDAAVGLQSLRDGGGGPTPCEHRYLRPEPRVRAGLVVGRNRAASSCMDLSDGLADAVRQVAAASHVGMRIDAAALPISDESRTWHARRGDDAVRTALAGGDDYELLFTVRPAQRGRFRGACRLLGQVPITRIGVVTKETELVLKSGDASHELPAGYQHFT
jgi:thiamine-monophosphate kinase